MIIEDGDAASGGFKRVLTFTDENGAPVSRSEAAAVHISERGTDGKAVSQAIIPIDKL